MPSILSPSRYPGPPVPAGLPPVRPGLPSQRPLRAAAPRALLVGVVHRLRGRRPDLGRDSVRAAGAALQPLAEVSPSQGRWWRQQQLVACRGRRALAGCRGARTFPRTCLSKEIVSFSVNLKESQACLWKSHFTFHIVCFFLGSLSV